jgi:hypothetical protein
MIGKHGCSKVLTVHGARSADLGTFEFEFESENHAWVIITHVKGQHGRSDRSGGDPVRDQSNDSLQTQDAKINDIFSRPLNNQN